MAVGFSSNFQKELSRECETCDVQLNGSFETRYRSIHSEEPIIQLCEWNIPHGRIQIINAKHKKCQVPTQDKETGAVAVRSSRKISNCIAEIEQSSSIENEGNIRDPNTRILGLRRLTSMFGSDLIAPCCRADKSERTPTCSVEGAGFCLGGLSMVDHCARFGGGPGIDRDSEQVSGKFCGVGVRSRVEKCLPSVDLREFRGTLELPNSVEASDTGSTRMPSEMEISENDASAKQMLYMSIKKRLRDMVGVLDIMKLFVLPRVPGLQAKGEEAIQEFMDHVEQLTDSGIFVGNVLGFKKCMAGVILDFDVDEFMKIFRLSVEEASVSLQNSLKVWNEDLNNFMKMFVSRPTK